MAYLPAQFVDAIKASMELEILVEITGVGNFSNHLRSGYLTILKSTSSVLQKIEPAYSKSNVSKIDIVLIDVDLWRDVVAGKYMKNRRTVVKIGPKGAAPTAFHSYFTGFLTDFALSGDSLSLEIRDDLYLSKEKIPEENDTKTQSLAFQNQNPIDIKKALLMTYAGIDTERVDSDAFDFERDTWFNGWKFDRVLTDPKTIKSLLNELDEQTLAITFPDGDKISQKAFAPPYPGRTLLNLDGHWKSGSLSVAGGMMDNLVNQCIIYFDWDESGDEDEENFQSIIIVGDSDSQGASQWDEIATKEIKSKWIRSYSIEQPNNITGVVIYCCSRHNAEFSGYATLAYDSANKTLTFTAPQDLAGNPVKVEKDGKYIVFSNDMTKYIRIIVTVASLPGSNQSDNLTITNLDGLKWATLLATHWVARYRDPKAELTFELDLADAIHLDQLIKVADILKITCDHIVTKGIPKWNQERILLTSVRPDFQRKMVKMNGIHTTFAKRYGFIGPATLMVDYDDATQEQREYAFIADISNGLGVNNDPAYYVY